MTYSLKKFAVLCITTLCIALPLHSEETPFVKPEILKARDGLKNSLTKLLNGEEVCIGYFGGSITEWSGWRELSYQWLETNYPKARLRQVNASMGGTGSDLGVYRIQNQLLDKNPDLIFVEFSVNDREKPTAILNRTMEGIVRKIRRHNPKTDICFVYTLNIEAVPDYDLGRCPRSVAVHDLVAEHYGIPSINVAWRIVQMVNEGKAVYNPEKDDAGKELPVPAGKLLFAHDTCHPTMDAHKVYSEVVTESLKTLENTSTKSGDHPLPPPRVADNLEHAKLIAPTPSMLSSGWNRMDDQEGPGKWLRKYVPDIWETDQPGEKLTFKFKGSSAMLYYIAGPEGGQVLYSMDGKPAVKRKLFSADTGASVLWPEESISDGEHTLTITLSEEKPDKSALIKEAKNKPNFNPALYETSKFRVGGILLLGEPIESGK